MMDKVHTCNRNILVFSKISSIFGGMLEIPDISDMSDQVFFFFFFFFFGGGGGVRSKCLGSYYVAGKSQRTPLSLPWRLKLASDLINLVSS